MPRPNSVRGLLTVAPLVAAVGVLGGCNNGGGGSATAPMPQMAPMKPASEAPKTPQKGMDRIGSESGAETPLLPPAKK